MFLIIIVFITKVIYLAIDNIVYNYFSLIFICVFIAIQLYYVRKISFINIAFLFSFVAEVLNTICVIKYGHTISVTMICYPGMHIFILTYFIFLFRNEKKIPFYEFPLSVFIIFLAFGFLYWQQMNIQVFSVLVFYSALLCINLALSYNVSRNVFSGILMLFMVDTIVIWSLIPVIAVDEWMTGLRAFLWLPFLTGELLLRKGLVAINSKSS